MDIREFLTICRDKIAQPGCWCAGHPGIDNSGKPVPPCEYEAVAWCSIGVLVRVESDLGDDISIPNNVVDVCIALLDDVAFEHYQRGSVSVSDSSQASAVDLFNKAIATL